MVTGFLPLWRTVPAPDLTWIDQSCAHGTFRTWAALTVNLQNALLTTADASIDRALLRRLFQRVAPPLSMKRSGKRREGDRMLSRPPTGTRRPTARGELTWRIKAPSEQAEDCLRRRGRHCAVPRCGGCSHCEREKS
ncbi:hypothetical protein ACH4HG_41345 [Streptomyces coeruleorubidus]|uniref:hypothetical protein n=1 Tax=Streptomyces coeruleorubidus TaxID=116188 RepID=UPI0037A5779C